MQGCALVLQVDRITHHEMGARESMVAMLQGTGLPGVGPVTAARLADHFGKDLPAIMDAADAATRICRVKGIGAKTSIAIKEAWDNTKGGHGQAQLIACCSVLALGPTSCNAICMLLDETRRDLRYRSCRGPTLCSLESRGKQPSGGIEIFECATWMSGCLASSRLREVHF